MSQERDDKRKSDGTSSEGRSVLRLPQSFVKSFNSLPLNQCWFCKKVKLIAVMPQSVNTALKTCYYSFYKWASSPCHNKRNVF